MIKQTIDSYGYKKLLVYKKADELQMETSLLASHFPPFKPFFSLSDQMIRCGRSVKQNIVEGWKRNTTSEYYTFLGYSIARLPSLMRSIGGQASNAELEEDCNDIISGKYPELMGKKGIMGKMSLSQVEKLPFYPLDAHLSPIIQLKLRCKEVNFLLDRLQKSLVFKMEKDHSLSPLDRLKQGETQRKKEDKWLEQFLKIKN